MNRKSCTETRPCQLATCYDCRVELIERTAKHMIESGSMTAEQAQDYRYSALSMLNFEQVTIEAQQPVKPKAKARKPFTPKPEVNYQGIADGLRTCDSRDQAADMVKDATIPELRHIASLANCAKLTGKVKADLLNSLIEQTAGFRLDHEAVRNGAQS